MDSLLFMFHVYLRYAVLYYAALSLERADFLVPLCFVFSCAFNNFQYGDQGQVWYMIISTPGVSFIKAFKTCFCL